ncbi:muts domain V-domain-containing protein [Lentinula raphanica]|uniref:Muts domain V-domain-containing protein n=1 Tax=Lentinula raphanica TaxID=153919 RepID=A0AA38P6D0_9AGAR|nr:muts domain V-domain-containing protein [Lentinula raphanica]
MGSESKQVLIVSHQSILTITFSRRLRHILFVAPPRPRNIAASTNRMPDYYKGRGQNRKRKLRAPRKHGTPAPATNANEEHVSSEDDDETVPPASRKKVRWEGSHRSATQDPTMEETMEGTAEAETEENVDSLDTEDAGINKIYLTAWCQNRRVGMAYYDPIKCMIYVLEDTEETSHFDLTKMVLEQASPDVVLTSSRSDDTFVDVARDFVEGSNGIFQIRPNKEFSATKGKDRLMSLQLLSELPHNEDLNSIPSSDDVSSTSRNAYDFMAKRRDAMRDPTTKRWNASIRLSNYASLQSSPLCMASVGALLDHLVRERAVNDFEDEGIRGLEVRDIECLALNEVMQINADALFSLQIFENEDHASMHSTKTKEGLSLAGILNVTNTALGRVLMRSWLLRPSLSLSVINSRHDAVECFLQPENITTANTLNGHLKGIKNVPRMLSILRSGKAKVGEWQGLLKFTVLCAMLKETLSELHEASHLDIVKNLFSALDIACFREVGTKINDIIDWEESAEARRVCVRPHIDEELDNRKHVYHGIDSVLSKVAERISQVVPPEYASSLNIVYFPQLGFLICVPMRDEWRSEVGVQVIDGWSFQFSSESHVYLKSQEMHDMDAHIGDLHSLIVDREIEIVQALLEEILVHDVAMSHACDVCAELDCLLAFADVARAYDYRRPVMVEDNVIDIVKGRHPLQELVVDTFVPNDARITGGDGRYSMFKDSTDSDTALEENELKIWNSVLMCTGANACGKSVYLKQIALIQYMAQIGCFVPAEEATLGIVDKIFTRISTRESVSKVQSAFMIDLNQVSLALRNCTGRSLILLDEFGKGTLPTDGAGLLCGVIKHLLSRKLDCPKVLVATHFHDVFREEILDPKSVPISFLHMQVMFTSRDGKIIETENPGNSISSRSLSTTPSTARPGSAATQEEPREEITYLYRVMEGLSLDSHAAKCAELFGIPSRLVQRARYVSQLLSTYEIGRLLDERMSEKEAAELEEAESICRRFLCWNLSENVGEVKQKLGQVLGREPECEG